MSTERPYQRAGWCVPVPVRPSTFTALLPEHQALNVQVDLAQLAPFGFAAPGDGEELLHADLQTHPTINAGLRLGSGRAGFYRGKYIKGMGRTQLAANWNAPGDVYHGTGHMMASAAVREYIVSRYLAARGAAHLIVPCEGLLLSPLDDRLRGFHRVAFPGKRVAPIDTRLQAITVKDGDFARHSNFVWSLNHLPPVGHYGRFFGALHHYLGGGAEAGTEEDADPAGLAAALSRSAARGFDNFLRFVRLGVFWGSFHNNFTLDGRFLDLEVPTLFGRPFFGVLSPRARLPRSARRTFGHVIGCEALEYLFQVHTFVTYLRGRLGALLAAGAVAHPAERAFVEAFLAALDDEFNEGHLTRSRAAACDRITAELTGALGLGGAARNAVAGVVWAQYDSCYATTPTDLGALPLRRLPLDLARSESFLQLHAFGPDFIDFSAGLEEAQHVNRALDALDSSPTLEALLLGVEALAAEIGRPAAGGAATPGPPGAATAPR